MIHPKLSRASTPVDSRDTTPSPKENSRLTDSESPTRRLLQNSQAAEHLRMLNKRRAATPIAKQLAQQVDRLAGDHCVPDDPKRSKKMVTEYILATVRKGVNVVRETAGDHLEALLCNPAGLVVLERGEVKWFSKNSVALKEHFFPKAELEEATSEFSLQNYHKFHDAYKARMPGTIHAMNKKRPDEWLKVSPNDPKQQQGFVDAHSGKAAAVAKLDDSSEASDWSDWSEGEIAD